MAEKKAVIPSGKHSAFTVIRPKLTVSPYVKHVLKRKRDGHPPEDAADKEFDPKKLRLKQASSDPTLTYFRSKS